MSNWTHLVKRPSPIIRIAFGLSCMSSAVILTAATLGLIPDRATLDAEHRRILAETVAINSSLFISQGKMNAVRTSLSEAMKRDPDLVSARLQKTSGESVLNLSAAVAGQRRGGAAPTLVSVPIVSGKRDWGTLQLAFRPSGRRGIFGWLALPIIRLLAFFGVMSFACFFLYMRSTLRYLDPSKVMPGRVRQAFDTLADGLMIVDDQDRIVHTNEAFQRLVGLPGTDLRGRTASQLPWQVIEEADAHTMPWTKSIQNASIETGVRLRLSLSGEGERTFLVNSSSISDDEQASRGALVSLDDVTDLESSRSKLQQMLVELEESQDDIQRKNEELEQIARTDPLTNCVNRRAFYSDFEVAWSTAARDDVPLSCVMVDIDHFKSVNDRLGHAAGDAVLQSVAATIQGSVRESDIVCRYGGEEFCILMPVADTEQAAIVAERARQAITELNCIDAPISASLGISSRQYGAAAPAELLDQADQALYYAKEQGRNRVVSWLEISHDAEGAPTDESHAPVASTDESLHIPFSTVSALTAALAFRDPNTAEHVKRVAELCAITAKNLLSPSEIYTLEVAALLHDIGKIGIPDAVLHKPGKLTEDEWRVMRTHDQMRVTIVRAAGASDELIRLIRTHHARFGGNSTDPSLPSGEDIPLGSRILAIAEAYDTMINGSVYRAATSRQTAFAELRSNAGPQFDPELVERFIQEVSASDRSRTEDVPYLETRPVDVVSASIDELNRALQSNDPSAVGIAAWRVKGIAARNGDHQLIELAKELEEMSTRRDDMADIAACANELLDACEENRCQNPGPTGSPKAPAIVI